MAKIGSSHPHYSNRVCEGIRRGEISAIIKEINYITWLSKASTSLKGETNPSIILETSIHDDTRAWKTLPCTLCFDSIKLRIYGFIRSRAELSKPISAPRLFPAGIHFPDSLMDVALRTLLPR